MHQRTASHIISSIHTQGGRLHLPLNLMDTHAKAVPVDGSGVRQFLHAVGERFPRELEINELHVPSAAGGAEYWHVSVYCCKRIGVEFAATTKAGRSIYVGPAKSEVRGLSAHVKAMSSEGAAFTHVRIGSIPSTEDNAACSMAGAALMYNYQFSINNLALVQQQYQALTGEHISQELLLGVIITELSAHAPDDKSLVLNLIKGPGLLASFSVPMESSGFKNPLGRLAPFWDLLSGWKPSSPLRFLS